MDNHQAEVAAELDRCGLAVACEVDDLSTEILRIAAARTVVRAGSAPRFGLVERNKGH